MSKTISPHKKSVFISIDNSFFYVTDSSTDNKPALIQVMAWHKARMNSLPETRICVTKCQRANNDDWTFQ